MSVTVTRVHDTVLLACWRCGCDLYQQPPSTILSFETLVTRIEQHDAECVGALREERRLAKATKALTAAVDEAAMLKARARQLETRAAYDLRDTLLETRGATGLELGVLAHLIARMGRL